MAELLARIGAPWTGGIADAATRRFDRLSLLSLICGLYFFQIWAMAPAELGAIRYALIALSCVSVVAPRLSAPMVLNAAAFAAYYLASSPVASNNQLTAFFVSLTILGASLACWLGRSAAPGQGRESVFETIAGPGRWLLAAMYFFGIYHKINADFLNPQVSCAVELYSRLAAPVGLSGWSVGQWGSIAATFVVEAIAMVALFVPRWKRLGMLIGIPFHIVIGWTGYAYYKDFCTIVLFLYALFLPREAVRAAMDAAIQRFGGARQAGRAGLIVLGGGLAAYLAATGGLADPSRLAPTHLGFMPVFTLYALVFYAFVVLFVPATPATGEATKLLSTPRWLMAIPALFFLGGLSPYLGLKTESSIAMYSNLHTEGGVTNHLIMGQAPFAAGYQNDLVRPISSNSPAFDAAYIAGGLSLVRFEFDRMLASDPGLRVTFEHDGVVRTSDASWVNTYASASFLERKFLTFKPVDFSRPKVCTH